ncbi:MULTISPECIES: WXG100 family type VII secretion target [Bacillus cereus group]|uniref:WXG100 family type VII secretion target n=1 Tax=Bacillus cereus group TaxID=86661 RepID=UPI003872D869|nr:WXG100 family type VII secretion target [Bacillus cereus]MDA1767913.1 WXG100 family type VII secretion target [Bacillus cereus]
MVQIKVTPEMLEEVAHRASNTRIALESIHNNLCNEIDHLCFQWIGASNQQFIQMFNDARPKAFTSINSIIQVEEDLKRIAEKFRNADGQDVTMEEGAMCGRPSSEEKGFDGKKLARDLAGEISGEYDVRRAWDGVDPSTGEKLSTWERIFAGGMAVAGLTPVGKIAKVGKGVKMTANAVEAANTVKKAEKLRNATQYSTRIEDKVIAVEKQNLPGTLGATFKDGNYRTVKTTEDINFYRAYGGQAKPNGTFVTTVPAPNKIQAKIDLALLPEWKNTRQYEAVIQAPEGTILQIGRAEKQTTMSGTIFKGDEDQVLLPFGYPSEWIKEVREIPGK